MHKPYVAHFNVISLSLMLIIVLISGCSTPREIFYVALGDSIPAGYGVGDENYVEFFADYLRQDLGADVIVHNIAQFGQETGQLLDSLQNDASLREAVADADVITIWIGWNDLIFPLSLFKSGMCGGEENLDCLREKVAQLKDNIDGILDEILALNSSEETRIMIADTAIPLESIRNWKTNGWFDVLQVEAFESWQGHIVDAARERGIIVVFTYKVIHGPLGDQENERMSQDDGSHFNKEGHKLIADLHREAWE